MLRAEPAEFHSLTIEPLGPRNEPSTRSDAAHSDYGHRPPGTQNVLHGCAAAAELVTVLIGEAHHHEHHEQVLFHNERPKESAPKADANADQPGVTEGAPEMASD